MFKQKKLDRIVDMHCHILPGIDDGSRNMVETLKMLKIAASEGITEMIVTPHFKNGHHNASPQKILDLIEEVQQTAETLNLGITLYPGNEIYYFQGVEELLDQGKVCTMNHTDYVLVEFSPLESFTTIWNALDSLSSYGFCPIIAHVERYECMVKDWHNVEQLKRLNVGVQVNAADVTGEAGLKIKQFIATLLKNEIVDYVGTDAHRSEGRVPAVRKCETMLMKKYNPQYVEYIMYRNAAALID